MKQIVHINMSSNFSFSDRFLMFARNSIKESNSLDPWQEFDLDKSFGLFYDFHNNFLSNEPNSHLNSWTAERHFSLWYNYHIRNGNVLKRGERIYVWNPHTYIYT